MAYELGPSSGPSLPGDATVDPGLRAFLGGVYLKLAGGLVLSAAVAWAIAYVPGLRGLFFVSARGEVVGFIGLGLILLFSPVAVMALASFAVREPTARGAGRLYWTIAALVGGSLSILVLAYSDTALVSTFLVTACAFAGLSLWGYMTRRNLTGLGNFLLAALIGLIAALVVNLFLRNPAVELVLNALGVVIFAGLIAADTQRLKLIYYQVGEGPALRAASDYGALSLYLNFINLFELLLALSGSRSRR